jgi:hypothetical protein
MSASRNALARPPRPSDMARRVTVFLLVVLLAAACARGGSASNEGNGTIRGSVLLGPTCPVERISSPCPPHVLADTRVEALDMNGDLRASVVSDADGRFEMQLDPGEYVLTAVIEGDTARSAKGSSVRVRSGEVTRANVLVDSGIR